MVVYGQHTNQLDGTSADTQDELNRNNHAHSRPNKITGANAGGPRQLPMRTRRAARVAQFGRWPHCAMRYFSVTCLLALSLVGCNHPPRSGVSAARHVWHSADSTLEQRAQAVSKLIPVGSTREKATMVLGTGGTLSHFYGPTVGGFPPRQLPDHDEWCLIYKFPGGGVRLDFDPPISWGGSFVRAVPFRTLTNITFTTKP